MNLAEYQRAFLDGIFTADPDTTGLRGALNGASNERLAAYIDGYPARVLASIEDAFPAVARVAGHGAVHTLAEGYARAHLSETWDLGRIGLHFPKFLTSHPLTKLHPFLAELARLEWMIHTAFFTRDAGQPAGFPVDASALSAWKPQFSPAVAVFLSEWPVVTLREAEAPPEGAEFSVKPAPECALVFRDVNHFVLVEKLTVAQAGLQEAVLEGATFAEALELTAGLTEEDVAGLSALWVRNGLLRQVPL